MATMNPFDLLGDDAEDPSQLIAAEQLKAAAAAATAPPKKAAGAAQDQGKQAKPAQMPSKPLPPAQAGQIPMFVGVTVSLFVDFDVFCFFCRFVLMGFMLI